MGLEINTSSLRRGLQEFHPTREIVALAAKAGVEIFTIGSDAHSLEQVGDHLDEAQALLEEFNLVNHVFNRRRATPYPAKTAAQSPGTNGPKRRC
jgi:histidinol-phosphatase (PHP family)